MIDVPERSAVKYWKGIARWLHGSVDGAWLAVFRILFGLAMAVSMWRFEANGWVERLFIEPTFHFRYWGLHWVHPLRPELMHGLFWVLGILALSISAGLWFRVSTALFLVGFTYLQLIDVTTYLNHYYLASLLGLLLLLSPAHCSASLDAWRRPALRSETVSRWWLVLFRFQVAVVYTFAGLAKANGDWLLHGQPLRIWLASRSDIPWLGTLFEWEGTALTMSWAGFLFDTTIAGFLLWRCTRPFAYAAVIGFHAITGTLFPIGMFPVIMVLSALVFFSPSWPRELGTRWRRRLPLLRNVARGTRLEPNLPGARSSEEPSRSSWRWLGVVSVATYCAVQVILPLRFLGYEGDVRWHEQGMRFSWRVMVREKNGSVTFVVTSPNRSRTWHISPGRYLTELQEREMSGQPDLILQLAHHVRDDFNRRGLGPVEVRVDALVSWNGRKLTRLIDPTVNLAEIDDGIHCASWILPTPSEPPPHLHPIGARRSES